MPFELENRTAPADYNITTLIGDYEYGYYAAAAYSCHVVEGARRRLGTFLDERRASRT